ncbi:BZ3500_MvSof-1268-A1-R1_Chr7-1g09159 [Microbotryum saponariae]|uniref:Anaphase-promoting complex subunit 2 n=1 Tax=Microbotryum saponariae TaxID=289078 RepID=A0A2X0N1M3_9BASI|nr:BZ3501_MvSof-1269-A2-R1_Chr7-1g08864 [Microbotryum saponariae]SDA02905.1 BZ3500_MvSof-1268-A1-R1_Chr7-1g09159 [Microbotryum saponariae]
MDINVASLWRETAHQFDPPHYRDEATEDQISVAQAWPLCVAHLNPAAHAQNLHTDYFEPPVIVRAAQAVERAGLSDRLFDDYLLAIKDTFHVVQAEVLDCLDRFWSSSGDHQPLAVVQLLHRVGLILDRWQQPLSTFWPSSTALAKYKRHCLNCLYAVLPPEFTQALGVYLRYLLHLSPPLGSLPPNHAHALSTLIPLLDRYDPLLFGLIYEEIEKKVARDCKGVFDQLQLQALLGWVNGPVLNWVAGLYEKTLSDGAAGSEDAKKLLKPTFTRFEYHVHKTMGVVRASEMFDIIVNFPRSTPALEDLKVCLLKTDQRAIIVNKLRHLNEQRLLHPGVDTKDIISQYIASIRCLRLLDPQGVLLSRIADPIRQYLRAREDTIRCIVSSLIEEGNELVKELAISGAKPVQDAKDEAENYNDPKWTPDPIDAPADFRKSKGSDIIQLLVSIYDTKDVFVKELQVLLAQRLLAVKDYAFEKEIKNVEVLKVRFGEASLQGCEVMIRDLQDSKAIDVAVHERNQGVPLHATIVSRLFWPSFQPAPLKLPGHLGRAQREYDQAFTALKPEKKLRWLPQLGTINITVDLRDRSLTLDVTPLQASVLEVFQLRTIWTADSIGDELRIIDTVAIRNVLYFWNNHGVLKSLPDDEWKLLEFTDAATEKAASHVIEEEAQAVQSVEAQQIEQMRVYWQYIKGMLLNLGALPIARIHSTLNMLVPTYKGKTTDELVAFLDAMRIEGLVEKTANGSWKIVK